MYKRQAISDADLFVSRQGADTSDVSVTAAQVRTPDAACVLTCAAVTLTSLVSAPWRDTNRSASDIAAPDDKSRIVLLVNCHPPIRQSVIEIIGVRKTIVRKIRINGIVEDLPDQITTSAAGHNTPRL